MSLLYEKNTFFIFFAFHCQNTVLMLLRKDQHLVKAGVTYSCCSVDEHLHYLQLILDIKYSEKDNVVENVRAKCIKKTIRSKTTTCLCRKRYYLR